MTSEEEWEYYKPFIEEAERDIEENGVLTEEEFWSLVEEEERKERRERLSKIKDITRLRLAKCFGRISKRFVRI